jgi:hypothetical protein
MAARSTTLIGSKDAESAQTTQYTAVSVTAIIDKFTGTNHSGAAATLSVNLVPAVGSAGTTNLIVKEKSLAAGEAYTFPEIVGHTLAPGDKISTIASAAGAIAIRCSGREIT